MAKQLNVNLAFSADTSKVKAQLQDLQSQLNKLTLSSKTELGITKDIEDASRAAAELSIHLKNATNQQTGTLDFSKLNQSIKQSSTSLQQYGKTLQSLGPQGQQAFMSLAQAVANSEVPIRRTNAMLKEMGTTLANTARWQLSSSMLHGFMGAVQSAYGYAQDLNESLNNIRIVTGQNIDQMAKFAEEANKAARALSTTTTEYTNASLIYYQQGLNDQQVKERTDITIKMANVARQSAEVVSDQMTAVWNNFYDGSKSLEHYADVMTALGAATASSTDEISEGLNKFAAVANTVGLSYEYAASALATVTATTRQSADVVGTAFKTLFARIQDLELGKTLDDGTTLGSYSQALAKVGVQIKDTSGEMKSMDTILEEMAVKWDTLGKAEQIALAQSVAGVRQYTQLIALMDNWDFMEKNLATSNTASGALQAQADIYAESWEAARDRVKAAAESVYQSLLKDEFFIDVLNSIEKIISFIDDLIDNLGGLKGVLTAIGAIVTKVFSNQLAQGLTNLSYNIKMRTESGRESIRKEKSQIIEDARNAMAKSEEGSYYVNETASQVYGAQLERQQQLLDNADRMTEAEKQTAQMLLDQLQIRGKLAIEKARELELAKQGQQDAASILINKSAGHANATNTEFNMKDTAKQLSNVREVASATLELKNILADINNESGITAQKAEQIVSVFESLKGKLRDIDNNPINIDDDIEKVKSLIAILQSGANQGENLEENLIGIQGALGGITQQIRDGAAASLHADLKDIDAYIQKVQEAIIKERAWKESTEGIKKSSKGVEKAINNSKGAQQGWADILVSSANVAFSVASAFNMLSSAIDTLSDPDISIWEKFTTVLMTLGMVIPTLVSVWKTLKSLQEMEIPIKAANAVATWAQVAAEKSLNKEKGRGNTKTRKNIKETVEDTKQKLTNAKQKISDNWNQSSWDKASDTQKNKYRNQIGPDVQQRYYQEALQQEGYIEEGGNFYKIDKNGKKVITYRGKGKRKKAEINPVKKSDTGLKAAQQAAQKTAGKKVDADAAKLAGKAGGKALGAAAATAAIVVASVVAAGAVVKLATDYYNRHEIAAQKAAESAKRLAENYNELKAAESAFRDNISSYTEAVNSLDQLTKGTTAYKEAVIAANEEALKLLETNDNLQYTIDEETGLIEIDTESLDKARADSLKKEQLAQATALSAQQNAKNKQLEADMVEFNRKQAKSGKKSWDTDDTTVALGAGGAAAAFAGGALAVGAVNAWNPVGWAALAVGALTTLAVGAAAAGTALVAAGEEVSKGEQEALEAIAAKREELGTDLSETQIMEIAEQFDSSGDLGRSLAGTTEALKETNKMAEAINENTAAVRANTEMILSQQYGSAAAEWLVDTYDTQYNKSRTELEGLNKKINRWEDLDEGSDATKMIERYINATGKQLDWDYHVAEGTDENREFLYYDEEGKEQRIKVEDMIEEIAVAEALKAQENEAFLVNEMLNRVEATQGQDVAMALASWTTTQQLSEDLSLNDFEDMQNSISAAGGAEQYLLSTYGYDNIEDMAKELGYKSGAALLNSFNQAVADKEEEFKNVSRMIPNAMQDEFTQFVKNSNMGELDASTQTNIASSLADAYVTGGETGYYMMEKILGDATNGTEIKDLSAALNSLNWKEATPEILKDKLKELGIETSLTTAELEALIDLMSDGVVRLTGIGETYTKLISAIEDLNVSQEEYAQMAELGLGHYFTKMYDGTYQLIGAVEDFEQVLRQIMQIEYTQTLNTARDRLDEIKDYQNTTQNRLDKKGWGNYDEVSDKISTTAVFDDYSNKVYMQNDGTAATTKNIDAKYETKTQWKWDWFNSGFVTTTEEVEAAKTEEVDVSNDLVNTYMDRIDYIEAMGIVSDEMIQSWRTSTDMAKTEAEILNTYLPKAMEAHKKLQSLDEIQQAAILEAEEALLSTAKDSRQRREMYEVEGMHDQSYAKAVNAAITQESWEGLDQAEVASYADYLTDCMGIAEEGAEETARAVAKMNKGVETLNSNWSEWAGILKNSSKSSQEYAKAMQGVRNTLSDILDVSEEFISVNFISNAENLELIGKAAEGSADAIDALGWALAKDIAIQSINLDDLITIDGIDYSKKEAIDKVNTMMDELQSLLDGSKLTIGENLNTGAIFSKLQEIVQASQMTVEQANAFYRSMGFTPHFKMVEAVQAESVPLTTTYHHRDVTKEENGVPIDWVDTEYSETVQVPGGELHTMLPSMTVGTADGKKPQVPSTEIESVTYTGGGSLNNFSSSNKGGAQSKSKKADKVKKSDVVQRYKEVNDSLEKITDSMEDANKAMDRLYGASRLQQMQKQNDLIEDEIELLKQKKDEALVYLEEDRLSVADAAKEAGVILTFDENGLISNYTEAMTEIYEELDNTISTANKDGIDDNEQAKIDLIQERADNLQSAIDQYDKTRKEIDDLDNQLDDKFYEWQDNNAEMLSYKLEFKLELNDMELEEIEYELGKIEDDFYSMAEAAALISSSDGKSQLGVYTQELADYAAQQKALEDAYAAGEISQAAYAEGLKEVRSGTYENLTSLRELDKSMMEYYGNTLDMAAEEMAKYTDRMDHQTAVLDHYSSLLEIMGKSNDYKSMGTVLEGKAQTLEDQAAVAKETMEMYQGQAADRLAEYQKALVSGDEAAAELYLQQYEAALNAANEAEDAYLSKAEEWAEALKAVLENKLAEAGADLEKALTGGVSFDTLTTQMERANSLQEEYLTTTNKIYETNKMINIAQQAIDKTTNTVAKQKLKSFQEETAQLQNQGKLSQYELDIQQAKYDLLLAEIALEEAQQAKSTVRLQRDSEGNFGYVYTADASQVSDAEQKVADAQNALYNKGLEGANDYTQKYQETMQEMYDTLTDIQSKYLEGGFASEEEYHRAMEEAKEYYYQKLQDYSSLYQIALTTDSQVVADAWSTDFADMTTKTEDWMKNVNDYTEKVDKAFNEWSSQMDVIAQDTGTDLDSLESNVKDITVESENLRNVLNGEDGVIAAIDAEATAVAKVTSNYSLLRTSLQETMKQYDELGKKISKSMKQQQDAIIAAQNAMTSYANVAGSVGGTGSTYNGGGSSGKYNPVSPVTPIPPETPSTTTIDWYATPDRSVSMGALTVTQGEVSVTQLPHSYGDDSKWCNYSLKTKGGATGYVDYKTYNTLKQKGFLGSFDTGGYTGDWGQGGKLAMLHEKELILNADDTTNFLASLEVLREIVNTINLHSLSAQLGGLLSSPGYINTNNSQMLEQQVHIEASFPGVTERSEIEEAFNNLINRASQYINRI